VTNAVSRLFKTRKLAVLILVFCLCCQAKDKTPDVSKLVSLIVNWGDKLSSPGVKTEMRLIKTGEKDGHNFSSYTLYITGLPHDQSYALLQWPINLPEPTLTARELYITDDGRLCAMKGQCHDDVGYYVQLDFLSAKAEPHRMLLLSKDEKYKVAIMVIPSPIVGVDQGCSVEVIRATEKFEAAILRGKGFKPNEKFKYTSNSAGEVMEGPVKVDEKGEFILALAPFVTGKDVGNDEVTFHAQGCSPVVSYKWGTKE
jgi:hypothetical protein